MHKWQAIVFDLDDTLYPEREYVLSGFRAVADWAGTHLCVPRAQAFAELKRLFDDGVRGDTFNIWLITHGLPVNEIVPKLVEVYRKHDPEIAAFPETHRLLRSLKQRYRLGLVSDGYLEVQQRKLAVLKLSDLFDAIVLSDEWGREHWKPSTKPFEVVLENLGVRANHSVYVGDNASKDFYGARAVGMFTVRIRRRHGEYAQLSPPTPLDAPHLSIESLLEIEPLLIEQGIIW